MNTKAIIFQRKVSMDEVALETQILPLEAYARARGFRLMSVYIASGEPHILTIDMLIDHCMAWAKPGHILLGSLDELWIGPGREEVLRRLEEAGAAVHVVGSEVR